MQPAMSFGYRVGYNYHRAVTSLAWKVYTCTAYRIAPDDCRRSGFNGVGSLRSHLGNGQQSRGVAVNSTRQLEVAKYRLTRSTGAWKRITLVGQSEAIGTLQPRLAPSNGFMRRYVELLLFCESLPLSQCENIGLVRTSTSELQQSTENLTYFGHCI